MNTILLEEKYILEYIKDMLNDIKLGTKILNDAKYHHNTRYYDAPSVCQYGILSLNDLNKLGIKKFNSDFLEKMSDTESHINGIENVSLAVVGLDDIYPNEYEYNPLSPESVDFLVASDVTTSRSSIHYGNEFLTNSISVDKLRSVDIRLLKLIELFENGEFKKNYSIQKIIEKYNYLKSIACIMKQVELDMPLREMSCENGILMDLDKLSSYPELILK